MICSDYANTLIDDMRSGKTLTETQLRQLLDWVLNQWEIAWNRDDDGVVRYCDTLLPMINERLQVVNA